MDRLPRPLLLVGGGGGFETKGTTTNGCTSPEAMSGLMEEYSGGRGGLTICTSHYDEVWEISCYESESSPRSTSSVRTPDFTVLAKIVGLLNLPPHSRTVQLVLNQE